MNKVCKIIVVAFAACIVISCGNMDETYTVTEQTFNEAVYASGELFPEEYHILRTSFSDRILNIFVKEGDMVESNDILVALGTPAESRQPTILENQLAIAKTNTQENSALFTELKHKISLAKEQYEHDEQNSKRYHELAKEKAVSLKAAEEADMIAKKSLTEYNNLQQQYTILKNQLNNQLLESEKRFADAQQSQQTKILRSPIPGKVYNINFKKDELTESNKDILMVGSSGQYKLELLIDERDIGKVALGQKVFFETSAFVGQQFDAVITKIDPVLQKETHSFKVEAKVQSEKNFYPQSSVEANIVIRERATALMIPSEYLQKGDSVLCRFPENEIKKIKVITGVRNGHHIEIISGLHVGDIIHKNL